MLGIIIGVAAVVIMISVGNSASFAVTNAIRSLGSNVVFVFSGGSESETLSSDDILSIEKIPYVKSVVPELHSALSVSYKTKLKRTTVVATTPLYESVRNFHPLFGRFITENDMVSLNKVVVIGSKLSEDLFENENPIGKILKIQNMPFVVVGVLEKKGGSAFGSPDDFCIIPLTTAQQRLFGVNRIDMLSVEVADEDLIKLTSNEINELLKRNHNIKRDEDRFYNILTQEDILSTTSSITNIMTILLAGIASVSLLVGGIGIMNIMLVSVTERTREIGIRKAVGAKRKDILIQFLIEAMFLCIVGGSLGIFLGIGGSYVIARFGNWQPIVRLETILLGFLFSAAVGMFFGIYPAYKAANMNPIEALRYE
jgi:ABC-type antimicrobial peptide transport system permease subunit